MAQNSSSLQLTRKLCLFRSCPNQNILLNYQQTEQALRVFSSFFTTKASAPQNKIQKIAAETAEPDKTLHTSHQLNDKLLCYLCTVRIPQPLTDAVGRLYLLFSIHTRGNVFVKQFKSVFAEFLNNNFTTN